ncbi:hypothetical protein SS50377_26357 [Spironucleus salmonicida]|uniref:Uncharacterized protein n=1 Tax=Spironucleus salmonicida TaxID=348837 RepID=V6LVP8_9EUKA|nr:hypothetical protein SS50377_26357 [Spironucleus salmonicida]|eukprot:EST47776.1 Hypothetical protein SS50377_12175 [Spironucleus salmonicida]
MIKSKYQQLARVKGAMHHQQQANQTKLSTDWKAFQLNDDGQESQDSQSIKVVISIDYTNEHASLKNNIENMSNSFEVSCEFGRLACLSGKVKQQTQIAKDLRRKVNSLQLKQQRLQESIISNHQSQKIIYEEFGFLRKFLSQSVDF